MVGGMETKKHKRHRLPIAVVAICLCFVLADGNLPSAANGNRTEPAGCMMLAALPHRRLAWESPKRATALTEAVCPNTVHIPTAGFTLIEMSIVLVIIGLIVGGVLVGQSLISAAQVRAQITQIEKFQTAANTFREKYGFLPGDIPAAPAAQFGFAARGQYAGEGDGNGTILGVWANQAGAAYGGAEGAGETVMFWVDLSKAGLIDSTFTSASSWIQPSTAMTPTSNPSLSAYFPAAKIGRGNYISINSTNPNYTTYVNNFFALSGVTSIGSACTSCLSASTNLTVQEASSIDAKIDDGLPQSGSVIALYNNQTGGGTVYYWAGSSIANSQTPFTSATAGSSSTCFDNSATSNGTPGVSGAAQHYSVEISNGSNVNCALSFKMQAGD